MQKAHAHCHDRKTNKNRLKIACFGLKSDLHIELIFKPEEEIRAFLRMRSGKRQK